MKPNSFLILHGRSSAEMPDAVYAGKATSLLVHGANPRFITIKQDQRGFELFIGEAHQKTRPESSPLQFPAGTRITLSEETGTLTIKCDRLGTATVYWRTDGNTLQVSNRKENLLAVEDEPDWSSIQQYLYTGFTIKASTFIKDIAQTEPNTVLTASSSPTLNVTLSKRTILPSNTAFGGTDLIDKIADQLSRTLSLTTPSVLMMSAGWDSRTLLTQGTSNLTGAYTHGDLSSREISLARKLTGEQRLDHLFVDVKSCSITPSLIDTMLQQLGSALFPIWFIAAQNIQNWKDSPLMSGVLGELLGGHYGLMSWGSRTQKLASSLLLLNDCLVNEHQIQNSIDRYCSPPQSHWFTSNYGQEILDLNRDETTTRSKETIQQYYRETGDWQRALEEFNMAHRARQYILKQGQAASSTAGYTIPFADEHLSDLVRALDFKRRIHNKANQRILKSKHPALLQTPMAATLIAARHPILFQELSRFFRIARENFSLAIGRKKPRLGWFNYEHLYKEGLLHSLTDTLTSDFWDKDKMHTTLRSNPNNQIDAGSTLDMICKIKTVDHNLATLHSAGKRAN